MSFPLPFNDESFWTAEPAGTRVLNVRFAGPGGERWTAVGVGATTAEALAWARASAPDGTRWLVGGWSDLYGD
jgi:hypothetical protein